MQLRPAQQRDDRSLARSHAHEVVATAVDEHADAGLEQVGDVEEGRPGVVAVLLEVLADLIGAGDKLSRGVAAVMRLVIDAELVADLGAVRSVRSWTDHAH